MKDEIRIFKLALNSLMAELEELKKVNTGLIERIIRLESSKNNNDNSKDTLTVDHNENKLLDTKEVRKILKISHNTLQAIVRSGKLKQIRINGRNIRYSKSALDSYIDSLSH